MTKLHHVSPGDRLSSIAALHGVSPEAILQANAHKATALLPSGARVFASLGLGEDIAIPTLGTPFSFSGEPCDPGYVRDSFGACVLEPGAPSGDETFTSDDRGAAGGSLYYNPGGTKTDAQRRAEILAAEAPDGSFQAPLPPDDLSLLPPCPLPGEVRTAFGTCVSEADGRPATFGVLGSIVIPKSLTAPPSCIDPGAHLVQGACVCKPDHFLAPTGHCMKPAAFLPPSPSSYLTLGTANGDACTGNTDCGPDGLCVAGVCAGISSPAAPPVQGSGVAALLRQAVAPACPAGTSVDALSGEYCLDPNALPPLASAGCPAGTNPDIFAPVYCGSIPSDAHASAHCPKTSDGAYWDYDSASRLCMPPGLSGGDTSPEGSMCPETHPFYDSPSGLCMKPGPAPAPGAADPNVTAPTCTDAKQAWDSAKKACVVPPPPAPSTNSVSPTARLMPWLLGGAALVVLVGGAYYVSRKDTK
jgi:hypothetical protein